jgi:hypothetical protein
MIADNVSIIGPAISFFGACAIIAVVSIITHSRRRAKIRLLRIRVVDAPEMLNEEKADPAVVKFANDRNRIRNMTVSQARQLCNSYLANPHLAAMLSISRCTILDRNVVALPPITEEFFRRIGCVSLGYALMEPRADSCLGFLDEYKSKYIWIGGDEDMNDYFVAVEADEVLVLDAFIPLHKRQGEIILERLVPTIYHLLLDLLMRFVGEEFGPPET